MMFRAGHGYDVHRFSENRRLIVGGVDIPYDKGLLGHSDADVLLHAIADALLGAAALGDIGKHFPDTSEKYKDADSRVLLRTVCQMVKDLGYSISNIDATVVMQKPKLSPFIDQMVKNIADDCNIPVNCVNVKATTEEKLGFTGDGSGATAHAVCMLFCE